MIGTPLSGVDYQYRHLELEECDSTNVQCMNFAQKGEASNLWVTAKAQTAAKGSRGRDWTSLKGNLFASLMLRDAAPVEKLYQLTFVTAVSLSQAIRDFSKTISIGHKWPNDILLNDKKCSGILLESRLHGNETIVVVGIGVNCVSFPAMDTLHSATSLLSEGVDCTSDDMFQAIVIHMARNISIWDKGNNFETIRQAWLEKAYGMNQEASIKIPGRAVVQGVFIAIDENGLLELRLPDGAIQKFSTADVFFNQASI